jgi:hypothetical protein
MRGEQNSRPSKLASVLVRFNQVASRIVNVITV